MHDRHTMKLMKDDVVGNIPRELSRFVWHILKHGGTVTCEVHHWTQRAWQRLGGAMHIQIQ